MRVVGIIQARMGSMRLPGKSLLPLGGMPMLYGICNRVLRSLMLDAVMIACPRQDADHFADAPVEVYAPVVGEDNLISRYLNTARLFGASLIVRICADNPCVDPLYIDQAIQSYLNGCYPFYTNTTALTMNYVAVDGIGCEVFSYNRLQWLDRITQGKPQYREHPHQWFFDNRIVSLPPADLRLDVNTQADYDFMQDVFAHVPANFTTDDVVRYLGIKKG